MDADTGDGACNASKAEILRGVVAEKLTTAAQEIFAVVERTVAGYEEEAAGLRREIERQRRQLEALLQPRVKIERIEQFPVCGPAPGGEDGAELPDEEEQDKYEPSVEDSRSLGLICYTQVPMEDAEGDEEHLTEPDYETAPRLSTPTVQSNRTGVGSHQISEPQDHIDLRIHFLEDPKIKVLSADAYQKYPMQELRCPCGLPEADFLFLLRSTFPQLGTRKTFGLFTTDKTKRLKPLRVTRLTAEEIFCCISSTGHSALYIQPKQLRTAKNTSAADELMSRDEECRPSQREDVAASPLTPRQARSRMPRAIRRMSVRHQSSDLNHVDLRICILEDSQTDVLSPRLFQKYPLQQLRCPRDLQEDDFLSLLRSTFPQLAAHKHFDFFTSDKTKRLKQLRATRLTPEEVYSSIRLSGAGKSALYIRLKPPEEVQVGQKTPQQRKDAAADSPSTDQTSPNARVQSDRLKPSGPQKRKWKKNIHLKVRILEDPQVNVLSMNVFKKYPLQQLRCPRDLQEDDFLSLLRSTFPQLAAHKHFDFFTSDRTKRLKLLRATRLTPEEVYRLTGYSALYIRLKPPEEVQVGQKTPQQRKDAAADSPSTDQTSPNARVQSDRLKPSGPQKRKWKKNIHLKVRILEDPQVNVLSMNVFQKYPLQQLRCPRDLQEDDFLSLLRSTFPQLAAHKHFDFFTSDRTKRLKLLRATRLTPEEVYSSIRLSGARCSALYIRLKAQEEVQSGGDEFHHPNGFEAHSSRCDETRLSKGSTTSRHEDTEAEEPDGDGPTISRLWSELVHSESEGGAAEVGNHDRSLEDQEVEKPMRKQQLEPLESSGGETKRHKVMSNISSAQLSCKVCCTRRRSTNMLIKHAWSHVDEPERLCGVCGEHSESVDELKSHLQSHQKTHGCDICGKSFLSTAGLSGHIAGHKGRRPHKCQICHKAFAQKSVLKKHRWVHRAAKTHSISTVEVTHDGQQHCNTCDKSFSSLAALSQHISVHVGQMASAARHNGRTVFICKICSKAFHTRSKLKTHMRVHAGEKPFSCCVCGMAFSHNHCVRRHMMSQHQVLDSCMAEAPVAFLSNRVNGTSVVDRVR